MLKGDPTLIYATKQLNFPHDGLGRAVTKNNQKGRIIFKVKIAQ